MLQVGEMCEKQCNEKWEPGLHRGEVADTILSVALATQAQKHTKLHSDIRLIDVTRFATEGKLRQIV